MDMSRFADDVLTGSTSNQKQIVAGKPKSPTYDEVITGSVTPQKAAPLPAASTPTVTRSQLPPAPSAQKSSVAIYNPPPSVAPAAAPAQLPPAPAPVASAGATKGGWSSVGGTVVTARSGETVSTLSRRYGVPERAIRSSNPSLASNAPIAAGQQVLIPTYVQSAPTYRQPNYASRSVTPPPAVVAAQAAQQPDMITTGSIKSSSVPHPSAKPRRRVATAAPAPVRTAATAPASSVPTSGVHVVNSGESLSGIAARYGLSSRDLSAANNITDPNAIRIGQRLRIPSGPTTVAAAQPAQAPAPVAAAGLPQRKPAARRVAEAAPAKPIPVTRTAKAMEPDPIITGSVSKKTETQPAAAPAQARSGPSFRWPVRGRIISAFGDKPNGQHNDGINMAVPEGTSVKAAEDGVVIYSGNELKGYGNLVLVRHAGGWVTAYGHNSELLARRGDTVRRGQVIARAGATGSVTQPQVHFELRQGSRPVDPQPYLAGT